jgi:hypothetical protein
MGAVIYAGSGVQAAFLREDSITADTKRMPATPSSIVGTSKEAESAGRPSMRALICSAMSA